MKANLARAATFGAGARMSALAVQFLVLIVMSRILQKDEFGLAMVAFSIYRVASYSLGTGIGNVILYHVGRSGGDVALNQRVHRTAVIIAGLASVSVACALCCLSTNIAAVFDQPGLAPWLIHMAPFMVFSTLSFTAMGSLEGRSRVTEAIVITELAPGLLRLVLMPLIWVFALPSLAVAYVLWIALALPWLWEATKLRGGAASPRFEKWTRWDFRYGSLYALISLLSLQLQGIDIIIVGALFSPEIAAEYAVAARLATLFVFFQNIILKNFTPRVGLLLRTERRDQLNDELREVRWVSLLAIGLLVGCILAGAPFIMKMFGDYQGAAAILAALALSALVKGAISGSDIVLKMSGNAGCSLTIALLYMFFLLMLGIYLAPIVGVFSIPVGMLTGVLVVNPVVSWKMKKKMGYLVTGLREIAYVALCLPVLALPVVLSWNSWAIASGGCILVVLTGGAWWLFHRKMPVETSENKS